MTELAREDKVFFSATLPLSWEPFQDVSPFTMDEWMHTNEVVLHGLATMDTVAAEKDHDVSPAAGKALERLEAKVDLSLSLLAATLRGNTRMPPPTPVTLSAAAVEWTDGQPPAAGSQIAVTLYMAGNLPLPLRLPGQVVKVEAGAGGVRVRAQIMHLSAEVQSWLERTVFRYHRRAIQARQSGRAAD